MQDLCCSAAWRCCPAISCRSCKGVRVWLTTRRLASIDPCLTVDSADPWPCSAPFCASNPRPGMCGITGIYSFNGDPICSALLERMSDALGHRGPDGSGRFLQGRVGLGHRRLSIIDIDGGGQPLANEDDTIHIVFNGE